MPDYRPYGVTQNADAAAVTANELVGERVVRTTGNAIGSSPATFSTAPYKAPSPFGKNGCRGKGGLCVVPVIGGTELCLFHTKQAKAQADRDAP